MPEIFKEFNWVDVLIVAIALRVYYISAKKGFLVEFFKLLGTLGAIYVGLHYYTALSDFVGQRLTIAKVPLEFRDFIVFVVLAVSGYVLFIILRELICRLFKTEVVTPISKWGGFLLGVLRSFLLAGLIIFALVISFIPYLKDSVNKSYLGKRFFEVAPATYSWLWNNLMSNFMAGEKFNNTAFEVKQNL